MHQWQIIPIVLSQNSQVSDDILQILSLLLYYVLINKAATKVDISEIVH